MVVCPFCGSMVTRASSVVRAETFAQVHQELVAEQTLASGPVHIGGVTYRKLFQIGSGETTEVFLGERVSPVTERVIIKLAREEGQPRSMQNEIEVLTVLQAVQTPKAAYYSRRVPQLVQHGMTERTPGHSRLAIVLRHAAGYWGSIEKTRSGLARDIDARHIAWIWRRVLDCLEFVHSVGRTHGDMRPEHLVVQPRDHGIMFCGWGRSGRCDSSTGSKEIGRDIAQSAWSMRELMAARADEAPLNPVLPKPMRDLLKQASEDPRWSAAEGASGIEQRWKQAVLESFGPPRFIPFEA
jgi:hypothetical protein